MNKHTHKSQQIKHESLIPCNSNTDKHAGHHQQIKQQVKPYQFDKQGTKNTYNTEGKSKDYLQRVP
jgi:hypothetical protein